MTRQYEPVPAEIPSFEEEILSDSQNSKNNGPIFGKRHEQMLLHGSLLFLLSCIKASLSIGIVAMNDPTASINPDVTTFNWTDKGIVLSCFFWGFMLPQFGSGWLASRYGPKWLLVGSTIACSVLNLLLPTTAYNFGSKGVMVCRVLQGFTQGIITPSLYGLLGKWVPPQERSRLGTFVAGGLSAGMIVITFTSGYLAASWCGWPMIFYLNSGLGILWSIIFFFIGSNSPADHPYITHEERFFIENSLPPADKNNRLSTPWIKIMGSSSFLALVLAHCAFNWGIILLTTDMPIYFKNVMKFDIKSNGLMNSLPHIVQYIGGFLFSFISDMIISKEICSRGISRKIMQSIGMLGPCVALIILANIETGDPYKAVVLLIVTFGLFSAVISGFLFNHLDLSPNHASVLIGITSQVGTVCTAIGLTTVQYIVTDEGDPSQWGILFYMTAGIFILSTVIFNIFGSGEVQPWNYERVNSNRTKKDESTA